MSVNYSWISHSLCRLEQWIAINIGSVEGGGSSDVIISKSKTLLTEETEHSKSEEALSVLRFIYSFYSWGSKLFFFPLYFCMHVLPPLTVSAVVHDRSLSFNYSLLMVFNCADVTLTLSYNVCKLVLCWLLV